MELKDDTHNKKQSSKHPSSFALPGWLRQETSGPAFQRTPKSPQLPQPPADRQRNETEDKEQDSYQHAGQRLLASGFPFAGNKSPNV